MPLSHKVAWGFAAGLLIVLVKIMQPDLHLVKSFFTSGDGGEIAAYIFIAFVTILLGGLSGAFSTEKEPLKLLLFCASVPALVSTATSEKREALEETKSAAVQTQPNSQEGFYLISRAFAQSGSNKHVCKEGSFFDRFAQSTTNYLAGTKQSSLPHFAVVVASDANFDKAKQAATKLKRAHPTLKVSVGCRRPGNKNYPIIVGGRGTKLDATRMKAKYEYANPSGKGSFISYYAYGSSAFEAK